LQGNFLGSLSFEFALIFLFVSSVRQVLLAEIGAPPLIDQDKRESEERECYALSAGIAFGFVNLGQGRYSDSLVRFIYFLGLKDWFWHTERRRD
jgi:hypothetical protein